MTCYEIARSIIDKFRASSVYSNERTTEYCGFKCYDASSNHEYFTLSDNSAEIRVTYSRIYAIDIKNPHGIVNFNLRLWLMHLNRMAK